jgi:transcription initiation factor TFIIIB Brf1 subunit/transcription initiation factor TFIIB
MNIFINEAELIKLIGNESKEDESYVCPNCTIPMELDDTSMICPDCGLMKPFEDTEGSYEHGMMHTESDDNIVTFRIQGPSDKICEKEVKSNSANKLMQRKNTEKQMQSIKFKDKGNMIPGHVLKNAADMYGQVQRVATKRGNVRLGIMAACIYYEAAKTGIARKPSEIAEIMGLDNKKLNKAFKYLHKIASFGCVILPLEIDVAPHFVTRYCEVLGINNEYKPFINSIVEFSNEYNISTQSRMITKVVGAIYLLVVITCNEGSITQDIIEEKCEIGKITFRRFYKHIHDAWSKNMTYRTVIDGIFNKHYPYPKGKFE